MEKFYLLLTTNQIRVFNHTGRSLASRSSESPLKLTNLSELIQNLLNPLLTDIDSIAVHWILDSPWVQFHQISIPVASRLKARKILDHEIPNLLIQEDQDIHYEFSIHSTQDHHYASVYVVHQELLTILEEVTASYTREPVRVEPLQEYLHHLSIKHKTPENSLYRFYDNERVYLLFYRQGVLIGMKKIDTEAVKTNADPEKLINAVKLSELIDEDLRMDDSWNITAAQSSINLSSRESLLITLFNRYQSEFKKTAVYGGLFLALFLITFLVKNIELYQEYQAERTRFEEISTRLGLKGLSPEQALKKQQKALQSSRQKWDSSKDFSIRRYSQMNTLNTISLLKEQVPGFQAAALQSNKGTVRLQGSCSSQKEFREIKKLVESRLKEAYQIRFSQSRTAGNQVAFTLSMKLKTGGEVL